MLHWQSKTSDQAAHASQHQNTNSIFGNKETAD